MEHCRQSNSLGRPHDCFGTSSLSVVYGHCCTARDKYAEFFWHNPAIVYETRLHMHDMHASVIDTYIMGPFVTFVNHGQCCIFARLDSSAICISNDMQFAQLQQIMSTQ